MRRRDFIGSLVGVVAWPFAARTQQLGRIYRVGILVSGGALLSTDERRASLVSGLAARGFVEGRNLTIESRYATGQNERLAGLVKEFDDWKAEAIVTFGYPAALAAKQSTVNVPVVVMGAGDPVATGLVDGLSRPGGKMTGMTEMSTELSAKRLELLKEALPNVKVVAMLWNAADLGMTMRYRAAENAARVLGVKVQPLGVREPDDFDQAFASMTRDRPDAILMVSDALTLLNRKRIMEFANTNHLPAMYEQSSLVRDGGLMSYGPSQRVLGDRVADFVSRILRGARPAELPLEQPTTFELVINLKTASSLGFAFPPTLLARAHEVIE